MYTQHRSVLNDYRTTTDHYDSGFTSTGSSTYYKARENNGSYISVDTDGRSMAEFDSGRGHSKPTRNERTSEFVLAGMKHVPSHQVHHAVVGAIPRYSYVPTSSYRTHSDQHHPRQEMITPKLMNISSQPIFSSTYKSAIETVQSRTSRQSRQSAPEIKTGREPRTRKRSVSPQMSSGERSRDDFKTHSSLISQSSRRSPTSSPTLHLTMANNKGVSSTWKKKCINMSDQSNRVDSFVNHAPLWNSTFPYLSLAVSGFYYTGQEDSVKCNYCQVEIDNWDIMDEAHEIHFKNSPNCSHLRSEYVSLLINEICPKLLFNYADFGERFKSFQYWPIPSQVRGGRLAEAGFYYMKKGIQTQCYSCGIVKDDWTPSDDPIVVHYELCPSCPHASDMMEKQKKIYKVGYKTNEDRLKSFKNIFDCDTPVDKNELANAGFVLIRAVPFTVQCPDCTLIVPNWIPGEDPLKKHMKLSTNCPFLESFKTTQPQRQYSFEDEGVIDTIQYPPSFKQSLSNSSTESISLPSQPSFDKQDTIYKRTLSTPDDTMDDSSSCIVCFDYPKECAIVPCGHFCVCQMCADKLKHCPICRQPKKDVLKIFIP